MILATAAGVADSPGDVGPSRAVALEARQPPGRLHRLWADFLNGGLRVAVLLFASHCAGGVHGRGRQVDILRVCTQRSIGLCTVRMPADAEVGMEREKPVGEAEALKRIFARMAGKDDVRDRTGTGIPALAR